MITTDTVEEARPYASVPPKKRGFYSGRVTYQKHLFIRGVLFDRRHSYCWYPFW